MNGKELVVISIIVAFSATATVFALTVGIPDPPCANNPGVTRTFTILADINGYNGSKYQQGSWPVLNVKRCDTVIITMINNDVQAHGLAVDVYANNGLEVIGGQSLPLRFLATRTGDFRVFCNIVCSVHLFMQQGLLRVT